MRRLLIMALVAGAVGGCAPFVPYAVHVDALVEEEPKALAPYVRASMAGAVIVGEAPAPSEAQYVARLLPHPEGTQLRIERRLTEPGFYDGTQLFHLVSKTVRAWNEEREEGGARLLPQASAPTCVTDSAALEIHWQWEEADQPEYPGLEEPVLIGGLAGLQRQMEYPELARRNGTEGVVIAAFNVDERGEVTCADVVVGLPFGINDEVLRRVQSLRFEPARFGGEPVKVRFSLPVKFRLR